MQFFTASSLQTSCTDCTYIKVAALWILTYYASSIKILIYKYLGKTHFLIVEKNKISDNWPHIWVVGDIRLYTCVWSYDLYDGVWNYYNRIRPVSVYFILMFQEGGSTFFGMLRKCLILKIVWRSDFNNNIVILRFLFFFICIVFILFLKFQLFLFSLSWQKKHYCHICGQSSNF